jgi:hypothetical protein
MCAFRRVEGTHAGPEALGILVPPSRQTFLILRPRSLPWDLLLIQGPEDPRFRFMDRNEAHHLGQQCYNLLEAQAARGFPEVSLVPVRGEAEFHLEVRLGPLTLVLCTRSPGQAYVPGRFVDASEALQASERLRPILCPGPDAGQEVYFNTRHFG